MAWWDLPERYGPWKTVYDRFWRWSRNGTLTMLVSRVRVIAEAIDELGREISVGSRTCDGHGRPLSVVLTGGDVNDCTMFEQVMAGIRIPRDPHLPAPTIPERRDQQAGRLRRSSHGGRPPAFDPCT